MLLEHGAWHLHNMKLKVYSHSGLALWYLVQRYVALFLAGLIGWKQDQRKKPQLFPYIPVFEYPIRYFMYLYSNLNSSLPIAISDNLIDFWTCSLLPLKVMSRHTFLSQPVTTKITSNSISFFYITIIHHTLELDTDYTQIWESNVGYQHSTFPQTEFRDEGSEVLGATIHGAAAQTALRMGSTRMSVTSKVNWKSWKKSSGKPWWPTPA